jgi:hypothetical protein
MKIKSELVYSPQPNATPDEVMQVLRLFAYTTYPPDRKSKAGMFDIYASLPDNAKRHFKVIEI